jgi:hypothetical protein
VRAEDPKDFVHQVTFPNSFVNKPQMAFALSGIDTPTGGNTQLVVRDVSTRADDFECVIDTPNGSNNRWVSLSWLAVDTRTMPVVTGTVKVGREQGDFIRFWQPPLGDREYTTLVKFAAPPEGELPDFESGPDIVLSLEGFDLERGTSPRLKLDARSIGKEGFTLVINTWGDSRINSLVVRYIAFKKM